MAKPQSSDTSFIRQCVSLWMAENRHVEDISVPLIACDLKNALSLFEDDYDRLSKGVSNELARLEKINFLTSRKGTVSDNPHPYGWGRPPRIYSFKKIENNG